jgi:hypothetical protein
MLKVPILTIIITDLESIMLEKILAKVRSIRAIEAKGKKGATNTRILYSMMIGRNSWWLRLRSATGLRLCSLFPADARICADYFAVQKPASTWFDRLTNLAKQPLSERNDCRIAIGNQSVDGDRRTAVNLPTPALITDSKCLGGKIRVHSRHSWPKKKKKAKNTRMASTPLSHPASTPLSHQTSLSQTPLHQLYFHYFPADRADLRR